MTDLRSSRALRLLAVAALVAGGQLGAVDLEATEDVLEREIGETMERVVLIRQALQDGEHDFALELAQDLERDLEANLNLFRENSAG